MLLSACTHKAALPNHDQDNQTEPKTHLSTISQDISEEPRSETITQLRAHIVAAQQPSVKVSLFMAPIASKLRSQPPTSRYDEDQAIQLNAHDPINPASTMKLLTTASALALLDITYRAETSFWIEPQVQNRSSDILQGPLYIKGQAAADFDRGQLLQLLEQLWLHGIRHIPEGVVFDRSFFQPSRTDLTAQPFDETPLALYNLIPDSLLFDEGIQRIMLRSNATSLSVALSPVIQNVEIDTTQVQLTGECGQWRYPGNLRWQWRFHHQVMTLSTAGISTDIIKTMRNSAENLTSPVYQDKPKLIVSGRYPANCKQQVFAPWFDRDDQLALMIQQHWQQFGGSIATKQHSNSPSSFYRAGTVPSSATQIASLPSIALPEWIRRINKYSDNPLARSLFLTLGQSCDASNIQQPAAPRQNAEQLSSHRCAEEKIRQYLSTQGINTKGIVLENGSGLSRRERISAKQLADVIVMAYQQHTGYEFVSSLPIAGMDGTMQRRLKQSCLSGRLRLKTGSLREVTSVAGLYLPPSGAPHVIVIILNGAISNAKARQLIDQWIWQYLAPSIPECRNSL